EFKKLEEKLKELEDSQKANKDDKAKEPDSNSLFASPALEEAIRDALKLFLQADDLEKLNALYGKKVVKDVLEGVLADVLPETQIKDKYAGLDEAQCFLLNRWLLEETYSDEI